MNMQIPPVPQEQVFQLWKLYMQASTSFISHLEQTLRTQANIKYQDFKILMVLAGPHADSTSPGIVRMGELATELIVSPSRLTYQVDRLIQRGWITRAAVETDRRGKGVQITEEGLKVFNSGFTVYLRTITSGLISQISADEAAVLRTVMTRILSKYKTK